MRHNFEERIYHRNLTRRDFLWLTTMTTASVVVTGCAVNPVTGQQQLMLVSEAQEIDIDRKQSPHQFSTDYGVTQDRNLNNYINNVGKNLAARSHRPRMPYSFRSVNATSANAYAFPGGSIAATRGILVTLNNEAELAALLGHEIGHVNARHAAAQMSKGLLVNAAIAIGQTVVEVKQKKWAPLVAILSQLGAGALLAHYSREDERQADALGMEYMTRLGYNPYGMVGLMEQLRTMSKTKPNIIETMFATHPMSQERYQTAKASAKTTYRNARNLPLYRERYLDNTADLRAIANAIDNLQHGEAQMGSQAFSQAAPYFKRALTQVPDDYAGLVMMAKCLIAQENPVAAMQYAQQAQQVYPIEAQAYHVTGIAQLMNNNFSAAYQEFNRYEKVLPGNPNTIFLKGTSLEGMQHREAAATEYSRYLNMTNQGDQAEHARNRLVTWGYMRPSK
jgi:predicted Zn-dependent protease